MWDTIDDWNNWMRSALRQPIQSQVDELTIEKTEYRYYEPLVGGIIPKFEAVL